MLRSCVHNGAIGESTTACTVHLRWFMISALILTPSATFLLCFLTPSRMWPMLITLIASQKVIQLAWFSVTFSCRTLGNPSYTTQSELVLFSILALHARSSAFSMKAMCDHTSCPPYFSFFSKSSTHSFSPANSLSSLTAVFFTFSIVRN